MINTTINNKTNSLLKNLNNLNTVLSKICSAKLHKFSRLCIVPTDELCRRELFIW